MRAYGFDNTIIVINGVEITGWAEGDDVIAIKRRVDSISDKVGAGGSMMLSISADKSGEFTFKLQQTSSSNQFLNGIMDLQESPLEFVPVSVSFQDLYRQDLATGTVGYLKRPADVTRGAAAQNQEWTVVTERLDYILGDIPDNIPSL